MVLTVKNLTKIFSRFWLFSDSQNIFTAVNNISFNLKKGEILGFLGHNGAGKTTTIQMLLGLLAPTSGIISYFGSDFKVNQHNILKKIGYASGYDRLPGRLTVLENLKIVAGIYNIPKKIYLERINFLLSVFGISHIAEKSVASLSAGQSTCVMLAKAFISNPELVLLDEPTASLDPEIACKVRQFILDKNKNDNTSILITSHNMNEVSELCDRVIILNKGEIVANDCPHMLARSILITYVMLTFATDFCFDLLVKNLNNSFSLSFDYDYQIEGNQITFRIKETDVSRLLCFLGEHKFLYCHITIEKPTFEDYFLQFLKK